MFDLNILYEFVMIQFITWPFAFVIAYFWAKGIDNMNEEHPDYKGDDFLNW